MNRRNAALKTLAFLWVVPAASALAQDGQPVPVPVVTVSASSTTTVPNDRSLKYRTRSAASCRSSPRSDRANARITCS